MKNKLTILAAIVVAVFTTACGTVKRASTLPQTGATGQPSTAATTLSTNSIDDIIAATGDWQTMQTGGNITLKAGKSFSSSIQMRMERDRAILVSLRPMLGIEVGWLLITADSLIAVDKVHKRFVAERVSLLTAGIPVTVSDVQDIFLGRPFVMGQGSLSVMLKSHVSQTVEGGATVLTPNDSFKGYQYAFTFDKRLNINSLNVAQPGGTSPAYQVNYADVQNTPAGRIAHVIKANAAIQNKKLDFSLIYKNIDWNSDIKIDKKVPSGYTRLMATDLLSLFN